MADLNVFELTNKELHKADKQSVKESVKRTTKKRKPFSIPLSKVKCESLSKFLEAEGDEAEELTVDYTPEDDVVLVIDPEMDEVPEDTEEAVEAAEDLVGQHVCKCSICGANYVTDSDITEEVEIEDQECPVCGETGDQIVVGVITPTDELSKEDEEDLTDVEVEDEEEVEDEGDEEEVEDEEEVDVEEDDDDFEESVKRARRRTLQRKSESVRRSVPSRVTRKISTKRPVDEGYQFDEVTFNRMLTRFAKENYSNVKFVKMTKGSVRKNTLTLEGVVTTTKGSKRPIKFVAENFKTDKRMTIKFKEFGPFTESMKNDRATFIVECAMRGKTITPIVLTYNFKTKDAGMKESRNAYSVTGKVLSESARKFRK